MIKLLLLFVAVLLFTTANAQPFEVTTADGFGADTYLSNDEQSAPRYYPDSTHGDEATMKLRNLPSAPRLKIPYLRFDISSIKTSGIEIDSAKIALWPTAYKGDAFPIIYIYALADNYSDGWDEMTTSFNNAPGFMPGMPFGEFELYDMVLVDSMIMDAAVVAPGSDWRDGIAYFQSEGGEVMDDFINNTDTDGLLTFTFIGKDADLVDHDFDIASKEDTIIHHPKLIFNTATAIDDEDAAIIGKYELNQNYPNPFNPATNIEFTLTKPGQTILEIYNTLGQPVATLIDGKMSSGHHQITFTADGYTSGIYFYKLTSGNFTEVKKMILMK